MATWLIPARAGTRPLFMVKNMPHVIKLLIINYNVISIDNPVTFVIKNTNLYSPRMPSSCAILLNADTVLLYGTIPGLIPWVCVEKAANL